MAGAKEPGPELRAERRFWRRHALWPAVFFAVSLAMVFAWHLDLRVANAFFFNRTANEWIGAHTWWAVDFIHTGGAWLVRGMGGAALLALVLSFLLKRLRDWRRGAGYIVLSLALVPSIVGGLQRVTNVDCPWNLEGYGGDRPYVSLFGDRPDELPRTACYPGSHASSGFALMAFYFLFLVTRPRIARGYLAGAVLIGTVFSLGQQSRGAHFLSHDLTSAAIAWFVVLALWRLMLAPRRAPDLAGS